VTGYLLSAAINSPVDINSSEPFSTVSVPVICVDVAFLISFAHAPAAVASVNTVSSVANLVGKDGIHKFGDMFVRRFLHKSFALRFKTIVE
jgi:hypothetical protein